VCVQIFMPKYLCRVLLPRCYTKCKVFSTPTQRQYFSCTSLFFCHEMRLCSEVISLSSAHALAPVTFFCNKTVLPFQFQNPFFFKLKFKFNNSTSFSSTSLTHRNPLPAQAQVLPSCSTDAFDFVVVNFYHFVFIKDPLQQVAKHLSFLESEVNFHFISPIMVRFYI
jgi:hypothetical protein